MARARGTSPGEPFVLEIWPPGHYSPIHDHGLAYGVTRMLHGSLHCTLDVGLYAAPRCAVLCFTVACCFLCSACLAGSKGQPR